MDYQTKRLTLVGMDNFFFYVTSFFLLLHYYTVLHFVVEKMHKQCCSLEPFPVPTDAVCVCSYAIVLNVNTISCEIQKEGVKKTFVATFTTINNVYEKYWE